jgi:thiamine-monophosphate kinase
VKSVVKNPILSSVFSVSSCKTLPMSPFTRIARESVAALGEERLIALIKRWLGPVSPCTPFGIGDDCAVLPAARGRQLLTVDPVVYPRHFNDAVPARAVGAKLLKRNLSDLAAMGGRPTAAVLALTLDPKVSLRWLEGFYRGLAACARQYGVPIVGGDIAQADGTLAASLTLLGACTGPRFVTRTGARVGDTLWVTGRLGGSLPSRHHYTFTPRLPEGAWLARQPTVRAMMDLSDGLAKDVHALTPRGAAAAIDGKTLPLRRGYDLRAALADGEDYELVFALAKNTEGAAFLRRWHRAFPRVPLTCIGRFAKQGQLPAGALNLSAYHGYEHLR